MLLVSYYILLLCTLTLHIHSYSYIPIRLLGICSDTFENFGPSVPLLGGTEDHGSSLGLYANGDLLHNGKLLHAFGGDRMTKALEARAAAAASAATLVEVKPATDTTDASAEPTDDTASAVDADATSEATPPPASEAQPAPVTTAPTDNQALASLFGKDSLVKFEFNTDEAGGTISFYVDSQLLDFSVKDVFALIGASEVFPCVSLCPFDLKAMQMESPVEIPVPVEPTEPGSEAPEGEGQGAEEIDPVISELEKLIKSNPSVLLISDDDMSFYDKTAEETATAASIETSPLSPEIEPGVAEDGDEVKAEIPAEVDPDASPAVAVAADATQPATSAADGSEPKVDSTENPAVTPAGEQPAGEESAVPPTDPAVPAPEPEPEKVIDLPIEKIRWMYETEDGWKLYSVDASRLLEEASRDNKPSYVMAIGDVTHTCNLETKKVSLENIDREFRIRRHVIADGLQGQWEMLSMKYEKPLGMQGQGMIKVLNKIWGRDETMSGEVSGLGFLFLYALLTGEVRAKVTASDFGGFRGFGNRGGGMGNFTFGGRRAIGSSASDSHRFGLLLAQLYNDKSTKSLPSSVINVLSRNRQVSLRMPKLKDTRKNTQVAFYNGWTGTPHSHT